MFSQGGSLSADVRGGWRTKIGHSRRRSQWTERVGGEVLGGGGGFSLALVDDFMEECGVKGAEK